MIGNELNSIATPLKVSIWLLWIESVTVALFAIYGAVTFFNDPAKSSSVAIALLVTILIIAAAIALAGYGMLRGLRTARSFAVTWQIFQIAISVWLTVNGLIIVGVPLILLTGVVFRFLFDAKTIAGTTNTLT